MMLPLALVPFPVVIPLAVAAILLALGHLVPAVASKVVAIVATLAVAGLSLWLAVAAETGTLVYWFGGWTPRPEVTLGIAFAIDPASGGFACFVALLFVASFVFAWGFFDEVSTTFHVMMLLFLAALQGFCLTRDLFNLFVWFEVMSVAAFALTGFTQKKSALAGALSFTICNSLASMCMLAGIGLLYARSGTLDFATMGAMIAKSGHDPVLVGGFCLVSTALLIKAAVVPFHFWLSDAHAVAPSPVSVIFSGCMVPSALFIWTKLLVQVFAGSTDILSIVHGLLLTLGCVTAVVGGTMAWSQRHLKRLLAFSTISHIGIMMTGVASLAPVGLAGLMIYVVGHGLVKAALFILVGVLLSTRASVDELDLRGLGQGLFPAGLLTALAALLLGGAPVGILHGGADLVSLAAPEGAGPLIHAAVLIGTALTGAAVLRATGRIYLGLGPDPGQEAQAPSDAEQEKADRPLWLMLAPAIVLLGTAVLVPAEAAQHLAAQWVPQFDGVPAAMMLPEATAWTAMEPWLALLGTVGTAAFALFRQNLPRALPRAADFIVGPLERALGKAHSGIINDYVVWIMLGLALLAGSAAV